MRLKRIIVVGGGLTGLFAGVLAANHGAKVTIAMKGSGGLGLSHGCIDILDRSSPSRSLARLPEYHPYSLTGVQVLKDAISKFRTIMQDAGYPFRGRLSKSMSLLTGLGTIKRTCFAPAGIAQGDLNAGGSIVLGQLVGFRDYFPHLIQRQARRAGFKIAKVIDLPLVDPTKLRDAYSMDYALRFEDPSWRKDIFRMWRPLLPGVKRLGLPAILGLHNHREILNEMEESLGVDIFEIPSLPPSIPGLRIERILLQQARILGVRIIEGAAVIGRVDGRSRGKRVAGVAVLSKGHSTQIDADIVLLATGGILNGGLVGQQDHRIRESVFDLPVRHPAARSDWVGSSIFHLQPYACAGIHVNSRMQPLGFNEKPFFTNLFAAGGLLAGPDRSFEGSRQGIDLATAFCAVEEALK